MSYKNIPSGEWIVKSPGDDHDHDASEGAPTKDTIQHNQNDCSRCEADRHYLYKNTNAIVRRTGAYQNRTPIRLCNITA
jgi:hypothetical protein